MRTPARRYDEIVRNALQFLRDRRERHTSVADMAAAAGCSPAHLRRIFRAVTGQGVRPHLRDARVERAKGLLQGTALSITEVALEVGFDSPSNFTRLFHRMTGTTPRQFRRARLSLDAPADAAPSAGMAGLVIQDDFTTPRLATWWQTRGTWRSGAGFTEGTGNTWLKLELTPRLPENLRIEFEMQMSPHSGWGITPLQFALSGRQHMQDYAVVALPVSPEQPGSLSIRGRTVSWAACERFAPGDWNAVRLELRDNRLVVALNGARLLTFQDPFPPPYADRCRFNFFAARAGYRFRRFRLHDLGLPDSVPSIRQGDALFTSGLFDQAREFYLRRLRPGLPPEEEMELRFKVGACLPQLHREAECRDWIHHILPLAPTPYWRRQCDLLLLQLDMERPTIGPLLHHIRTSLRDPALRDGLHPILASAFARCEHAGFLEDALQLGRLWLSLERNAPFPLLAVREPVAKLLKKRKLGREAARLLRPLDCATSPGHVRFAAQISLFDASLIQGRYDEAGAIARRMSHAYGDQPPGVMARFLSACCLRARQRLDEACEAFHAVSRNPSHPPAYRDMARLARAELLHCLLRHKEADDVLADVTDAAAHPLRDPLGWRSVTLASFFTRGTPGDLPSQLLADARRDSPAIFARAQNAVIAGIALELTGRPGEARDAWQEASRRFPAHACCFWGAFAKALAAGKPDHADSLRHFYHVRSELFFLTGLLQERRGNLARARRLFRLAVREDPTCLWPALLARRKLTLRRNPV